jgi:alpha-beta hydrolase superfamily lysophospholipase
LICKEHTLGVKGLSLGWIYEAVKRTNKFKKDNWGVGVESPILLLNATQDRLVSPSGNVQILKKFKNSRIENIDSKHEIFMESDSIRNQAWGKVDEFLASL